MIKLFLKSFFSNLALDKLYLASRPTSSDFSARSKGIFYFGILMASAISVMLFSFHLDAIDPHTYLDDNSGFAKLPQSLVPLQATSVVTGDTCKSFDQCVSSNKFTSFVDPYKLNKFVSKNQDKADPLDTKTVILRLQISEDIWRKALSETTQDDSDISTKNLRYLHVAKITYSSVAIYQRDKKPLTFFDDGYINIPITDEDRASKDYIIVVKTYKKDLRKLIKPYEPTFLANFTAHRGYKIFIDKYEFRYIAKVAVISKIVLALFALLIFLIVEGSPDALGLAVFLGFEALASCFHDVYRPSWMADGNFDFIRHYCFAMGDVFRVYFFCQLARMLPSHVKPWFLWGSMFAGPYAFIRYIAPAYDWSWINYLWIYRHLLVGFLAMVIMGRKAIYLRNKNLPWRVAALWLAIFASLGQTLDSSLYLFPEFRNQVEILNTLRMFRANSFFLFALSTFLNISNLENRVRSLSLLRLKSLEVEKELEIGRTVQRSFLKTPEIPQPLEILSYYEAATYVSGDTYFVYWNSKAKILTFLLNDVVGHGVQAGLKAFGCNIVAQTIWNDDIIKDRRTHFRDSLERYDNDVVRMICQRHNTDEFNAMIGAEFHLESGEIHLYRANYNFPTIIEPTQDPARPWKVRDIPLANRERTILTLRRGSFVLFLSDGLLETSREQYKLIVNLEKKLADLKSLDCKYLKEFVLEKTKRYSENRHDDKTMLIFHWKL